MSLPAVPLCQYCGAILPPEITPGCHDPCPNCRARYPYGDCEDP